MIEKGLRTDPGRPIFTPQKFDCCGISSMNIVEAATQGVGIYSIDASNFPRLGCATGSVADRCIRHAASTLYHTWKGSVPRALGQTKLALDDLVNQLYAGQDPPSVEETLESEHRAHAAFYPPVILFGRRCSGRDSFETCRIIPAWLQSVKHSDIS